MEMKRNKKRIIADDFGMTKGINRGILECYKNKSITRASLMVNQKYTKEAIEMIKEHDLKFGLHFNLTQGNALSDNSVLSKEFFDSAEMDWIENELKCQLKVIEDEGLSVSHIDMHHNRNFKRKEVHELLLKYTDTVRVKECDRDFDDVCTDMALIEFLFERSGYTELMVHPGYLDDYLFELSPCTYGVRKKQLDVLLRNNDIIEVML